MKKRKTYDTTPFDTRRVPPKQNLFFMPFIWAACWILTRSGKLKIHKVNMKGLKPPYLVLGTHHAFMDFYITPLALFPHRANYVSELEGFEAYGEWLYRQAGCLGTRKFINDINLVKNIQRVMKRKGILVLYPEARYANVGTASELPASTGKLVKLLGVPLVTINMKGNYLQSPIWNLKKRSGVKLDTTITQVLTAEEVKAKSVEEINALIKKHLDYDEYQYQFINNMRITYKDRAKGLEMPLYQCMSCGREFIMKGHGTKLHCNSCHAIWEMDELGRLARTTEKAGKKTDIKLHIPDWYEWERTEVIKQIDENKYELNCKVKIDALPNAKNFIPCGEGTLVHKKEGFYLTFKDYRDKEEKTMFFSSKSLFSIHTEYNYRDKYGQCVTLSTDDDTYFIYPLESGFNATKIQFATEYLHKVSTENTRDILNKVHDELRAEN
ncbi:MAG: hypothetical protein J6A59_17535 [Lachnospiraceae bacterium]|nr:hypothetical protein [Lachnospiraceae bacterium]